MPQALRLLNDLMMNAKPDKDAYTKYLGQIMKSRADSKSDQDENFNRLESYAVYGSYNPMRSIPSEETLKNTDSQSLRLDKESAKLQADSALLRTIDIK